MKKSKGNRVNAEESFMKHRSRPGPNLPPLGPKWEPVEERPGYEVDRNLSGKWRRSRDGAIISIMRMLDELTEDNDTRQRVEVAKELFALSSERFDALFQTVFEMESIEIFKSL